MDKKQIDMFFEQLAHLPEVQALAARYGFRLRRAGGSIDIARSVLKFEVTPDARQDPEAAEALRRKQFERDCICAATGYGQVMPDDYGLIMTCRGLRYKLVGVNRDAPKYPLITEALDGGPSYRLSMTHFRVAKGTGSNLDKVMSA
jgi:hypothetical protein